MRFTLDPPPGLAADDTSFAAAGRWADASNVRFWRGRAQVIGGWERLHPGRLAGPCRGLLGWTDLSGGLVLAFGGPSRLEIWRGGELADATPAGLVPGAADGSGGRGYGTGAWGVGAWSEPSDGALAPRTWSLAAWGETLLAAPRDGTLYQWSPATGGVARPVAGAPGRMSAMVVSATDQVFALGCSEEVSGRFNPLCIRHGSVRRLDQWTTAPDTTAREYVLPGGGRIVGGRTLGPHLLVWTSHALFLGVFTGSPGQPWRFDRVGQACGLIGPNAATVSGLEAFWLGPDLQVWRYALGGAPEPLSCPLRADLAANLAAGQGDKVFASTLSAFSEVRFDYPDQRDGAENSRCLVLSLADGAWSRGATPRTAMIDAGPAEHPVATAPDGSMFWCERGSSADGAPFAWFLESADQVLDEDRTALVRGVWPDLAGQEGPVVLEVSARRTPQGLARRAPAAALAPGQARADLRLSGRLFRVRLSGNASPTAGRIGRLVFDLAPAGGR